MLDSEIKKEVRTIGLLRERNESPGNSKAKGKKKRECRGRKFGFLSWHSAFVRQISHR